MEFEQLLEETQGLPLVNTRVLSAKGVNPLSLRVQISRWVKSGKLIQLKREMYLLAEQYRKISAPEFYIANTLKSPSYISLEKALEYHGLIPEAVSVFTSVTTKRPETLDTPVGRYDYRHVGPSLFFGYTSLTIEGQTVFLATSEKALLDFFYLKHVKVSLDYLTEMRLQNVGNIKMAKLTEYGCRFKKKGLMRSIEIVKHYIKEESKRSKEK